MMQRLRESAAHVLRAAAAPYIRLGSRIPFAALKESGKKAAVTLFGPSFTCLQLLHRAVTRQAEFFCGDVPDAVLSVAKRLEKKGEALCQGKEAHRTMAPGIILRNAGRTVARTMWEPAALMVAVPAAVALSFMTAFALVPATAGGILAALALGLAGIPPAIAAVAVAGGAAVFSAAAVASAVPAACNIKTGYAVRRDALAEEAYQKAHANDLTQSQIERLPVIERALYPHLKDVGNAAAHERVEWFEALKEKFPDDFAAAATPDADEISPVLQKAFQVAKKPVLQFKKPKRKGWIRRTLHV